MQFLFPGFLWALLALAVPVILHLFYFRRYKKIYFSNVRFLREVKEETSARNKLRNLLILLARCLALTFLVLAFAQPFIPVSTDTAQGEKAVSVYLDNSFSMQAFGEDLPLLDRARQRAREVILAYEETDRFQILTNRLSGSETRFVSREEALAALEEIEIRPDVVPLSKVVSRQLRSFSELNDVSPRGYLISDFQRSVTDLPAPDTSVEISLVPIESVQEKNVAIDSAWFSEPVHLVQQTSQVIVSITNYSTDDVENVKLTVTIDGQEKPGGTFDLVSGATLLDTVAVTVLSPGWHEIILRITDFPVQFDDSYLMTFYVEEEINILGIHNSDINPRLKAAFANNELFILEERKVSQLNYGDFRNYELIVIDEVPSISSGMAEALLSFADAGGNILLFPDKDGSVDSYNAFLSRAGANTFGPFEEKSALAGAINTESQIFRDVYIETSRNLRLPSVDGSFPVQVIQQRGGEQLLTYRNGTHFITRYPVARGNLIVCNAPLKDENSQLAQNAEIFIPLLYNSAVLSEGQAASSYIIGQKELIEVKLTENPAERILRITGPIEFIPRVTPVGPRLIVDPAGQITTAGFYSLMSEDQLIGVYGFNYNRTESDLSHFSAIELQEIFGIDYPVIESQSLTAFATALSQKERGITLWRWCIIFALAFLGIEILLIRAWKT